MLRVLPVFYTNSANSQQSEDIPALLLDVKTVLNQVNMSTPVLSSAYNYMVTLLAEKLPTNLIQAMRDSFGAHGVKRIGSDVSESFTWK